MRHVTNVPERIVDEIPLDVDYLTDGWGWRQSNKRYDTVQFLSSKLGVVGWKSIDSLFRTQLAHTSGTASLRFSIGTRRS